MMKKIKRFVLYICKYFGLFRFTNYIARSGLRILCYHNFTEGDELFWRPNLFINTKTFQKRMEFLKINKFNILSLDQALDSLYNNKLPNYTVVITIDDGWYFTKKYAHEILKKNNLPYTIYVTSYFSLKETPIYNIIIPYMFWKAKESPDFDFNKIKDHLKIKLNSINIDEIIREIIEYGYTKLNNQERSCLAKSLGEKLGISYCELNRRRVFNLLTKDELQELAKDGVDIQLHTHRHTFPLIKKAAIKEIDDNRNFIEPLAAGKLLVHFCYPSGYWKKEHFSYLKTKGIKSAATCEPGFNYPKTNRYNLYRFLDSEAISPIEFEAELYGFLEVMRKLRSKWSILWGLF